MKLVTWTILQVLILASLLTGAKVCFGQRNFEQDANTWQVYFYAEDPHYKSAVTLIFKDDNTGLKGRLEDLGAAVGKVPASEEVGHCQDAIKAALEETAHAAAANASDPQFGHIEILQADSSGRGVARVVERCENLPIADQVNRLKSFLKDLREEFAQIDKRKALEQAKYAALHTLPQGVCTNINLQAEEYKIRTLRVQDPFAFVPWIRDKKKNVEKKIKALIEGNKQQFTYPLVITGGLQIIDDENFMPETSDERVRIRVEVVAVENCSDKLVDLIYRVYSTQILPVLSAVPESRVIEKESPQNAAGQTNVKIPKGSPQTAADQTDLKVPSSKPMRFIPLGAYDSVKKISGGSRFEFNSKHLLQLPLDSIVLQGQGSSQMKSTSGSFKGSFDSEGWLAHSEWLANYSYFSRPTGTGHLKSGDLSAQFSAISRPFGGGNLTMRFGGLLEGGNQQGSLAAGQLAPKTVTSGGIASVKLYAGLDSRISHNVLSASYGLQLGSLRPGTRVDWRKQIGDVRHEFWYPLGDHRIIDLESRLTLGTIQISGQIPIGERFFGGNNEEFFIPNDTWQIRQNPVIRAIPGSSLFRSQQGAGGTKFLSYNLTAAYAVWRKALIPSEITNDDDFKSSLQDSIDVITNSLQVSYTTKDKGFINTVALLPGLQLALNELQTAVQKAQQAGGFEDDFKECLNAIRMALRRADKATQTDDVVDKYASVRDLLQVSDDVGENRLATVMTSATKLSQDLPDLPTLVAKVHNVDQIRLGMEKEFGQIDDAKAEAQANANMAFTRRTLNTMFKEVNLYAISPVFVFDIAKMGPQSSGFGGTRYDPGLGLRFEIATMAHFTAGYSWNRQRRPGEASGAIFFSIGVRDLFH